MTIVSFIPFFVLGFWSILFQKYYVIFVYILQGKMGKTDKPERKHATKVTKIPKTKRRKYWRNKTFICKTNNSFLLQNVFENGHNWSKYSTTRKAWRGWIQRSTDHIGQRVLWYLNSFTQLHWKYQDRCQRTQARHTGGFHLHLLEFPFVYQFNSRIGVLVDSSFAND